ncbi:MAG: Dyp-type peroxidase [Flammeovirgaceae bacterium]
MTPKIDRSDIQGIILYAYGHMEAASYVLLEIEDADKSKAWLGDIADEITNAAGKRAGSCLNLSLTLKGLQKLGLTEEVINTFPRSFRDGMTDSFKVRTFGDLDSSDPNKWEWGGQDANQLHVLLMLYAENNTSLESFQADQIAKAEANGLKHLRTLDTEPEMHNTRKEHFGFTDGIGQPYIEGITKYKYPDNTVKLGEFVLGYLNEYDKYPDAPYIKVGNNGDQYLSPKPDKDGYLDLGKNGSFLVFRQLEQHVIKFWEYMQKAADGQTHHGEKDNPIRVASKMVGRWPNGSPLAVFPNEEGEMKDKNHFGYHHKDLKGFGCPIGSHLRRSNPRDAFEDDPEKAIKFVKKNRIMRRGRGYGKPISGALDNKIDEVLNAQEDDTGRGLQFLCFNSHLSRQFELVQAQWLCNPKFLGMYAEVDPIAGHHEQFNEVIDGVETTDQFNEYTEPSQQVRKKYYQVPRFITVKGGSYFFTPGINAIKYLAAL